MIDPGGTKIATNRTLKLRENESTKLVYEGLDQPDVHAPIAFEEVYAAAHFFRKNTAPGVDKVTNAMIRNPNANTLRSSTEFFNNRVWTENGVLPKEWKEAKIILIPNPG
ncbi:hypothetical protein HPB49_012298 [Dermacentor silvarum]|uniref:Uncharacterized protein n=1 Tax=Dermacentor silvarum TaxID=543639 RepID=A0ACB8CF78_DERSI|nr:hypothetical protein HPB49_012298 [Dermacentor silvarum]